MQMCNRGCDLTFLFVTLVSSSLCRNETKRTPKHIQILPFNIISEPFLAAAAAAAVAVVVTQ
jgi:hypothetical protein